MKLKALALLLAACPAVVSAPVQVAIAANLMPADGGWFARCVDQLKPEGANMKARRTYCVCMHDVFDDNRAVSQSDKRSARETSMKQLNGPTTVAALRSFHNSVIAIAAVQVDS